MATKLILSSLAAGMLALAGCDSDAEEPESDETVGEEFSDSVDEAAEDTGDAVDEAAEEVDEEL